MITNLRCSYNVLCLLSDPDYANGVTGLLCSVRTQSICCCSLAMGSFFPYILYPYAQISTHKRGSLYIFYCSLPLFKLYPYAQISTHKRGSLYIFYCSLPLFKLYPYAQISTHKRGSLYIFYCSLPLFKLYPYAQLSNPQKVEAN